MSQQILAQLKVLRWERKAGVGVLERVINIKSAALREQVLLPASM